METKLPRLITALPGPNAKRVVESDTKFMSPSYTRDYPLVAKRGHGAIVEDVDGNSFLDFAAGIAVCSTGHCHPKVVAAIQRQAAELIHMSGTDFYYESMPLLAERLVNNLSGAAPKKAFFTNSGTEAIEGAMKLARYVTKRDKMIAFYGCFHGRTMGALSLTASKSTQRKGFGALLSGVEHSFPYAYRCLLDTLRKPAAPEFSNNSSNRFSSASLIRGSCGIIIEPIQGEEDTSSRQTFPAGTAAHLPEARHHAYRRRGAVRDGTHRKMVGASICRH
jgi:4-aminobutyrate aminotransferase